MKKITSSLFFLAISILIITSGCASAEKSASMVIDNASSVAKTAGEKAWIDPDATPTPSAESH